MGKVMNNQGWFLREPLVSEVVGMMPTLLVAIHKYSRLFANKNSILIVFNHVG